MNTVIFSHANSFGANTYRIMREDLKRRGFKVHAHEQFGHDSRYPVSNNWPHLIEELHSYIAEVTAGRKEPVWLVGHSLGGYLSLLTASHYPQLVKGVVLIDSPVISGWRTQALKLGKSTKLVYKVAPTSIARQRRMTWPDVQAVHDHFAKKSSFSIWDPEVLWDYANHGTVEENGQRVLRFQREVEAAIYSTLPDNMPKQLQVSPLQCPVTFIGGLQSKELKQVGMELTKKVTKGKIMMVQGHHLFPMEKPLACASYIESCLLEMGA